MVASIAWADSVGTIDAVAESVLLVSVDAVDAVDAVASEALTTPGRSAMPRAVNEKLLCSPSFPC